MTADNTGKTRYSDEELMEFKKVILEKLEVAQKNYEQLKASVMADESAATFNVLEEGASTLGKEEAGQRAQRQMEFIKKLQAALVRIENKTYGIDRMTGELIPKERLRVVPHATLSVASKNARKK